MRECALKSNFGGMVVKFGFSTKPFPKFAILMAVVTTAVFSVFANPVTGSQKEARAALAKAITFHREASDFSLQFSAKIYNSALDKNEEYQGKLWIKDSLHFRLEIPGGTYVSNGKDYWEYHSQSHQVVIRNAKDLEDKPLPGDVLLRFLDSDPLSLKTSRFAGKEYLELGLDPTRAMKNLDSLVVFLDKKNYSLQVVVSRDVSGNEATYTVDSMKRNRGLKSKEFVFLPPKGCDIVDMRE